MVLPEYIINEESNGCSEDGSLDSDDDDDVSDVSGNEGAHIPKGSLQGIV